MFRAKFVSSLAALQCIFFGVKGLAWLADIELSWGLVLIPLWLLLSVGVLFWLFAGAVYAKFS